MLQNFESMTWAEIIKATGDKKRGNLHHYISLNECSKEARDRMTELRYAYDEMFSLRLENKVRIFGVIDRGVMKVIWFDPNHKVYQCKK